jgi:hypothetical protein
MYPKFNGISSIIISNENEVLSLNNLQFISANKILFAYNCKSLSKFDSNVKEERKSYREKETLSTLGPKGHKILILSGRNVGYNCILSFGQVAENFDKIPFVCREAVPRVYDNKWQKKLNDKIQFMPSIMPGIPDIQMHLTKDELKNGCKYMADAANHYWGVGAF